MHWLDSIYSTRADPYFSGTDNVAGKGIEIRSQMVAVAHGHGLNHGDANLESYQR